jgi:cell wall-associated NlpC family hydrolase
MPQMMGAPVPADMMPEARTQPQAMWHIAGEGESTLLQRPPPDRPPPERRPRPRPGPRIGPGQLLLMTLALAGACFAGSFGGTMAAARDAHPAGTTAAVLSVRTTESIGNQMLDWAEAHETGVPYAYGGTGPYGYDCSGAVYAAALHVLAANGIHVSWPRDTYDIESAVYSGRIGLKIIPVSQAQRGDLLIWPGWGHVEFKTKWYHGSFGAETTGTRVGWHAYNGYWYPLLALRIVL